MPLLRNSTPVVRIAATLAVICILLFTYRSYTSDQVRTSYSLSSDRTYRPAVLENEPVVCRGPRGQFLTPGSEDQIRSRALDEDYPLPFAGSYDQLGIEQTWMTADDRYGPYGWRPHDDNAKSTRDALDWEKVNWAELQNECIALNCARFLTCRNVSATPRMTLRKPGRRISALPPRQPGASTGRTAIVLRSWDTFNYQEDVRLYMRSLLVETALDAKAQYTVYLLVDVHDKDLRIFESAENYQKALKKFVPKEFQSIAVLFDVNLLKSWYPDVPSWTTEYQVFQPMQLFSQFYPEFDHFWQIEMDTRFTGHAGKYLTALSHFAQFQPRKQARERASYSYIPNIHSTYAQFIMTMDDALNGTSSIWGPMPPPHGEITPIGPKPPVPDPRDDNFHWGVGEDADVIVLKPCADVHRMKDWVYRDWIHGFVDPKNMQRVTCPPAQHRASWTLLNEIHIAQATKGLAVPSEATLPSFAIWHGLKLILAPHPVFLDPPRTAASMDTFWNGGPVGSSPAGDAMGHGEGMYNAIPHFDIVKTSTWGFASHFPDWILDVWLDNGKRTDFALLEDNELPWVLRRVDGQIYAPNMALHPRKMNLEGEMKENEAEKKKHLLEHSHDDIDGR